MSNLVRLNDCPVGLFVHAGYLGFMTEYATTKVDGFIQRDAYVVESGEYFWGGVSDPRARADILVKPIGYSEVCAAISTTQEIKPLVWNEYQREGDLDELDAETPFGTFYKIEIGLEGFYVRHDYNPSLGVFEGLEAAQAAAQQDYEKRMRSAYGD